MGDTSLMRFLLVGLGIVVALTGVSMFMEESIELKPIGAVAEAKEGTNWTTTTTTTSDSITAVSKSAAGMSSFWRTSSTAVSSALSSLLGGSSSSSQQPQQPQLREEESDNFHEENADLEAIHDEEKAGQENEVGEPAAEETSTTAPAPAPATETTPPKKGRTRKRKGKREPAPPPEEKKTVIEMDAASEFQEEEEVIHEEHAQAMDLQNTTKSTPTPPDSQTAQQEPPKTKKPPKKKSNTIKQARQQRQAEKAQAKVDYAKWWVANHTVPIPHGTYDPEAKIPKMIHFIWLSPGYPDDQPPVKEHFMTNIREYQRLNPDYTIRIWRNVDFKQEFPELASFLSQVKTMAYPADMLRYHILEKYGGFYFDMDIAPLKPLEQLRDMFSPIFAICEITQKKFRPPPSSPGTYNIGQAEMFRGRNINPCLQLNNNVMASAPHHPVFSETIEAAVQNTVKSMLGEHDPNVYYNLKKTGPKLWSHHVFGHPEIPVLAVPLFHPCGYFQRGTCDIEDYRNVEHVFGMHEWLGSWKRGGKGLPDTDQKKDEAAAADGRFRFLRRLLLL